MLQQGTSLLDDKWLKEFTQRGGETALVAGGEGGGAEFWVAAAPPDKDGAAQQREIRRGVAGAGAGFVLEPSGVARVANNTANSSNELSD